MAADDAIGSPAAMRRAPPDSTATVDATGWESAERTIRSEDLPLGEGRTRATAMEHPAPVSIGPYHLEARLGSGGMGVVYRAVHETTGHAVALKTVELDGASALSSIRREIRALRGLEHPGVVRIVDQGVHDGRPWYAMELLEGPTLGHRLRLLGRPIPAHTRPTRPTASTELRTDESDAPQVERPRAERTDEEIRETLSILRTVCRALAYVHGEGIVHRDLKPDNVIVTPDRGPVLVDFGIAAGDTERRGREVLEPTGTVIGSPQYMAPEQIRGSLVDARADLYAVGCMLYEALVGLPPFEAPTLPALLVKKLTSEPRRPREVVPTLPDELERLVLQLLAREPKDRLGHADVVAERLGRYGALDSGPSGPAPLPYLYRPRLSGRGAPLAELEGVLERASAPLDRREGCRVFVGGESGVGKTRLVAEAAQKAAARGFQVLMGQCSDVAAGGEAARLRGFHGAPLHAFQGMLLTVSDRCRTQGAETFERLLGPSARILAPFEASIATLPGYAELPPLPDVGPEASRRRLHDALRSTLEALAEERPLLLVLDDLQWADEQSLAFLRTLGADWFVGRSVVVLGTFRLEDPRSDLDALLRATDVRTLRLGRLEATAVSEMVADMLAVEHAPEAVVSNLHRHTEGNPFFVAEYLHAAIERRLLGRDVHGRWVFAPTLAPSALDEVPLPRSLRQLVALRLADLSPDSLRVARMAAVLGREIDASVLAEALGSRVEDFYGATSELVRRQVLEEPQRGRFAFVHDKLREVAYDAIERQERRALHARARDVLRAHARTEAEVGRLAPTLAHHCLEAGDPDGAIDYLAIAGERALAASSAVDALVYLDRAIELHDTRSPSDNAGRTPLRRIRWERLAAEASIALGHLDRGQERGRAALRLCAGGPTLLDHATGTDLPSRLRLPGAVGRELVRQVASLVVARETEHRDVESRGRAREAALAAELVARAYFFMNDSGRSTLGSLYAANRAIGLGASPERARCDAQLSIVATYLPSPPLARRYARRADATASSLSDPVTDLELAILLGFGAFAQGDVDEARERLLRGMAIARELKDLRRETECVAVASMVSMVRAEHVRQAEETVLLSELHRRSGSDQALIWSYSVALHSAIERGDYDAAARLAEESEPFVERSTDRVERIQFARASAIHLARGDRERALSLAERVLARMEADRPAGSQLLFGYSATASTLLDLLATETAPHAKARLEALGERALSRVSLLGRLFLIARPAARRLEGRWHVLHGRTRRAERSFDEGLALARRIGLPVEEGRIRRELASLRPAERARHLERVAAIREATGAFGALGPRD
ncbi:MAG: protein kinase [Polyangiales bacterium]